MPVTDPVADMLTRIRNAIHAGHPRVEIPASNMKISIANVLAEEGFIRSYQVRDRAGRAGRDIDVELLYDEEGASVVTGLKRVSRPGLRVYVQKREIPRPYGGLGVAILTTPRGVMTGAQARRENVGGEVLCFVW